MVKIISTSMTELTNREYEFIAERMNLQKIKYVDQKLAVPFYLHNANRSDTSDREFHINLLGYSTLENSCRLVALQDMPFTAAVQGNGGKIIGCFGYTPVEFDFKYDTDSTGRIYLVHYTQRVPDGLISKHRLGIDFKKIFRYEGKWVGHSPTRIWEYKEYGYNWSRSQENPEEIAKELQMIKPTLEWVLSQIVEFDPSSKKLQLQKFVKRRISK
ncbi:hypothetical protein HYW76_05210 [Candidatus Pacearchaeota archaeon]|nr:hypothetical protein [Candidatus Pacearchaeota archaeon]